MGQPSRWAAAYVGLLILQTAAASSLLWMILPIFQRMISRLGEPQVLELWRLATIMSSVAVLQLCYWMRLQRVRSMSRSKTSSLDTFSCFPVEPVSFSAVHSSR